MADHVMQRRRPSKEILSGESADVYFARAEEILAREGLDPLVAMEVFARRDAVLCGIDEAKVLLAHVLTEPMPTRSRSRRWMTATPIEPKEVVLRIRARYRAVRPVRDGTPRHHGPDHRLGHGGARVRRRRPPRSRSSPSAPGTSIRT